MALRSLTLRPQPASTPPSRRWRAAARKLNLGEQLLDVMEGGPKLRRWYGAGEAGAEKFEEVGEEEAAPPPAEEVDVVVSEAASPEGEAAVFACILQGLSVRLLVADPAAAAVRYGAYVTPVAGSAADAAAARLALRGARACVVTGALGSLPAVARETGTHLVLLSTPPRTGLAALFGSDACSGSAREEAAAAGGALTVVRCGELRATPGGRDRLALSGQALSGALSREDAAAVCAMVASCPPPARRRVLHVVAGDKEGTLLPAPLQEPQAWAAALAALPETP